MRAIWKLGTDRPSRVAVVAAAAIFLLLAVVPIHAIAGPKTDDKSAIPKLAVGSSLFWDGGYVEDLRTHLPGVVACQAVTCLDYPLAVSEGGWRLRVAIDTPDRSTQFELDLLDPEGNEVASATNPGGSQFNMEVFAGGSDDDAEVPAGQWTVRVVPQEAHNAAFRLRAKLEKGPVTYAHTTQL